MFLPVILCYNAAVRVSYLKFQTLVYHLAPGIPEIISNSSEAGTTPNVTTPSHPYFIRYFTVHTTVAMDENWPYLYFFSGELCNWWYNLLLGWALSARDGKCGRVFRLFWVLLHFFWLSWNRRPLELGFISKRECGLLRHWLANTKVELSSRKVQSGREPPKATMLQKCLGTGMFLANFGKSYKSKFYTVLDGPASGV